MLRERALHLHARRVANYLGNIAMGGRSLVLLRRPVSSRSRKLPRYGHKREANAGQSVHFPEGVPDVYLLLAASRERDQISEATTLGHPVFLRRELDVILYHGDMDDFPTHRWLTVGDEARLPIERDPANSAAADTLRCWGRTFASKISRQCQLAARYYLDNL